MPLTPSERITLLKEISGRLSTEDWALLDLTLSQFSLPSSDQWTDTKPAYVMKMVEKASDTTLIDLAQHVGFQFSQPSTPRVDPPFWRKGMFRLFVSHLATHRKFSAGVQEALLGFGISGFVAHNDIEPTTEWLIQIETALATCDALVAFLHEGFHESNWTDQEIGFCMGRGVPTFAVSFSQPPYGFIGRFQAFNGNGKSAVDIALEVFDALRRNKQTQRRMSEVLVGLFEESGSFADAKARIGYLEELQAWDSSYSARVRSAVKSNSQVSGSWGVPERAKKLVAKWSK